MEINSITGYNRPSPVNGWGSDAWKYVKKKVTQVVDKVGDIIPDNVERLAKVASLAIPRQAYLLLVSLNVKNMAKKLSSSLDPVLNKWYDLGGQKAALSRAIKDGAAKKPFLGIGLIMYPNRGIGEAVTAATTITAAIIQATPIIVAIGTVVSATTAILDEIGVFDKKDKAGDGIYTGGDGGASTQGDGGGYTTTGGNSTTTNGNSTTTGGNENKIFGLPKIAVYAGGAFLAYKLLKK